MQLDDSNFKDCLNSGRFAGWVKEDLAEGMRVGITGTPGNILRGNRKSEVWVRIGNTPIIQVDESVETPLAITHFEKNNSGIFMNKKISLLCTATAMLFVAPIYASECHEKINSINAQLMPGNPIPPDTQAKIMELREKATDECEKGLNAEALSELQAAQSMLDAALSTTGSSGN